MAGSLFGTQRDVPSLHCHRRGFISEFLLPAGAVADLLSPEKGRALSANGPVAAEVPVRKTMMPLNLEVPKRETAMPTDLGMKTKPASGLMMPDSHPTATGSNDGTSKALPDVVPPPQDLVGLLGLEADGIRHFAQVSADLMADVANLAISPDAIAFPRFRGL